MAEAVRIARQQQVLFINQGTAGTPEWKAIGLRTPSSTTDVATDTTTETDVLGNTWTDVNSMELSQAFDPSPAIQGDEWQEKLVEDVMMNNIVAMANRDILWVMGWNEDMAAPFKAFRYPNSTLEVTSIGGDSYVDLAFTVHFGGETVAGTVDGIRPPVVFTPAA